PLTPGTQVALANLSTLPSIMDQGVIDTLTPGWFAPGELQNFWRATVQTMASSTSQVEVNEIQTANVGTTPTPAVNISGAGFTGAHIEDPSGDQVVVFSSNPAGGNITL